MKFIVCALKIEADPLIKFYNLKKSNDKYFNIFENERMTLIISGVGKINVAAAVSYMLKDKKINYEDVIINIGICGSLNEKIKISDIVYCSKILDNDSDIENFTDLTVKNFFDEGTILTVSKILKKEEIKYGNIDFVDMEASAFYQVASKFFKNHQIKVVKIVSDYLNVESLNKDFVFDLINKNIEKIDLFLETCILKINTFLLDEKENEIILKISEFLKLTFYQKNELENIFLFLKSQGKEIYKEYFNFLFSFEFKHKKERNKIFDELKNRLYK